MFFLGLRGSPFRPGNPAVNRRLPCTFPGWHGPIARSRQLGLAAGDGLARIRSGLRHIPHFPHGSPRFRLKCTAESERRAEVRRVNLPPRYCFPWCVLVRSKSGVSSEIDSDLLRAKAQETRVSTREKNGRHERTRTADLYRVKT